MPPQDLHDLFHALSRAGQTAAPERPRVTTKTRARVLNITVLGETLEVSLARLRQACVLVLAALPAGCFVLAGGGGSPKAQAEQESIVRAKAAAEVAERTRMDSTLDAGSADGTAIPASHGASLREALLQGSESEMVALRTRDEEELFAEWGARIQNRDEGVILLRMDADSDDEQRYLVTIDPKSPLGTVALRKRNSSWRVVEARRWLGASEQRSREMRRRALVGAVEKDLERAEEDQAILDRLSWSSP